ncbi:hypothetical protein [Ferrimonas balearica]|uniref:hypothetical protein n=1 Tax=Ferrimonas balearica TaxID=44012 RepID=UPI001C99BBC4|nr:hypothetical protein [Ferrimonas balearica]MBY5922596.1 hypothetical protein [Ferrimonas balearica]MBY5995580.1 hypothetical protein [Ferrimonas balearica]
MCRYPALNRQTLLASLLLAISGGALAGDWGWSIHYGSPSVSYGHYRYGDPYWSSRWRYPWYPSHWERRYWRDWGYRYPYRYSTPDRAKPQPKPLVVPTDTTLRQAQTPRNSRASLPANARLIQTANGTRYQWQGQCYRYDFLSDRYQAESCPQPTP